MPTTTDLRFVSTRRGAGIFSFVVSLPLWMMGGCADIPPGPDEDPLGFDEEELDEHWGAYDDVPLPKNLSTVGELVAQRNCSTAAAMGLSQQIAQEVACGNQALFENISDINNVDLGPAAAPFLQKEAARALRRAAARRPEERIVINSSWRSLVQQYILKEWEGSCGISVAARPGHSRHESGLSIDTNFGLASSMRAEGWSWVCDRTNGGQWQGCSDPPHWDFFTGADMRVESVRAFQRLWNKAHPEDRIGVDGVYGAQTAARIRRSPLSGFSAGITCREEPRVEQVPEEAPPEEAPPEEVPEPDAPQLDQDVAARAFIQDATGEDTGTSASIWRPTAALRACSAWSINEDFSSGSFNVHRYQVDLSVPGTTTVRFERRAGAWEPAVLVVDSRGRLVYGGDADGGNPDVEARAVASGQGAAIAELTVENNAPTRLFFFLTSWKQIDDRLSGRLPTTARYTFALSQQCEDGGTAYRGLDHDGLRVPRSGLSNATLRSALGVSVERYGDTIAYQGLSFVRGKVSWFGGPNDTGVTSQETGAITGERLRSLNSPTQPSTATLNSRPGDFYYIAMRWDYAPRGKDAWRAARLLVVNPTNNKAVVVRPVDWGPNINTRRVMDLSPQALRDLGLTTDQDALIAFVDAGTPLGIRQ